MPVLDHDTHPSTVDNGRPYGCHNRQPFAAGHWARDGFADYMDDRDTGLDARVKITYIPHRMSTECRYDMSLSDSKCAGCPHQGSGEARSERIRREGS